MQVIGVAMDERQGDQRHAEEPGRGLARVRHRDHDRLDSRPEGRMNIITMKNPKART